MKKIRTYQYTREHAERGECAFRNRYAKDYWVVFHGTSAHIEQAIEREGFRWTGGLYSKDEIAAVVNIFERLHWCGSILDGFGVLVSFTENDYKRSSTPGAKPVFFAESSFRGVLYASQGHAGGETVRALRLALEDLDHFLADADFRKQQIFKSWRDLRGIATEDIPKQCGPCPGEEPTHEHVVALWKYYNSHGISPGVALRPGVEPIVFSEQWLRRQLQNLKSLRDRCFDLTRTFSHGVVFAVRLTETDLPYLHGDNGGITFDGHLPADRILAKAHVAADVGYPVSLQLARTDQLLARVDIKEGVEFALRMRSQANP